MRMSFYGSVATAALIVTAAQAGAATITIDEFTDPQRVSDVPGEGLTNTSQAAASTAIGGFRDLQVDNDQGETDGSELRVQGGELSFSNISQLTGNGSITYDGDDDAGSLDTDGLGGVDLLAAGADPFFDFDVVESDANLSVQIDAFDTMGGSSTYTEILPESENLETSLPFAAFEGDVDFSDIGALQFSVESTSGANDGTISAINVQGTDAPGPAPIPLPAPALLLVGALGGFPVVRSLRRRG